MKTFGKHTPYFRAAYAASFSFAVAFSFVGCWSKEAPPVHAKPSAPAPQPRSATPTTPAPQPIVQAPASIPEPAPKAVSLAELTGKANPLSRENMDRVHVGMTFDQVNRSLGKDGELFSSGNVNSEIYRWSDDSGASIVAKFEDGRLVRKSIIASESATPNVDESSETLLSKAQYEKVQTGMTLKDIQEMLGVEPKVISDYNAKVTMYEWVDKKGSNFFARFDDGRLTRKTGFHVAPMKEESKKETETVESGGEAPLIEEGDNVAEPELEESTTSEVDTTEFTSDFVEESASESPRNKVVVVGSERDQEDRSYHPRAKFPDYTWKFRDGNYEVRVKNTADTKVKVGLRAGKYGKDLSIAPGKSASVKVNQGTYTFYYQYGDEPENVYTGRSFMIDGMSVADVEVEVFNEDYDIGNLNHAYD